MVCGWVVITFLNQYAFGVLVLRRCLGMGDGWIPIYIACLRQVVAFAPKVIKMRRLRRRTREGWRYGRMGGRRERARGEYRFMKLMKFIK